MKNRSQERLEITFYGSTLCPRCRFVRNHLREIARQDQQVTMKELEIMRHPLQAWQNGIRMIPALHAGKGRLSGFLLSKKEIESFIKQEKNSLIRQPK